MNSKTENNFPVDLPKLEGWLREHFAREGRLTLNSVKIPGNGYSAATLLIDADIAGDNKTENYQWVLRLEKPGQHIFLDTDIARQGQMMIQLRRCGLLAPNVLAIENAAAALGGKFLLMDRIEGVSLPQMPNYQLAGLLTQLSATQRHQLWSAALSTIASINRLNWQQGFEFLNKPQYGEPGFGQYLNWLGAWRDEAMDGKPNPIIDTALLRLRRDQPDNRHVDVLWGDSNPGNYLFTERGDIAAVLDFEASALGPAEIDLGWWFFMDEFICFGSERLPGLPGREQQIGLFESVLGRKTADLPYFELLAGVRMVLVIARTTNVLIKTGRLAASNKAACNNPATQMLAMKMNIPGCEVGEDFFAFAAAMSKG